MQKSIRVIAFVILIPSIVLSAGLFPSALYLTSDHSLNSIPEKKQSYIEFTSRDVIIFSKKIYGSTNYMSSMKVQLFMSAKDIKGQVNFIISLFKYERYLHHTHLSLCSMVSDKNIPKQPKKDKKDNGDQKEYIVRIIHNLWLEDNEFYDGDVLRLMIITEAPKGYEDSKIKLYVGGVFRSSIHAVQIE